MIWESNRKEIEEFMLTPIWRDLVRFIDKRIEFHQIEMEDISRTDQQHQLTRGELREVRYLRGLPDMVIIEQEMDEEQEMNKKKEELANG